MHWFLIRSLCQKISQLRTTPQYNPPQKMRSINIITKTRCACRSSFYYNWPLPSYSSSLPRIVKNSRRLDRKKAEYTWLRWLENPFRYKSQFPFTLDEFFCYGKTLEQISHILEVFLPHVIRNFWLQKISEFISAFISARPSTFFFLILTWVWNFT